MSNLIRFFTASSITVNRVASLLEEEGITSLIKNHTESALIAGFGTLSNDVDLYIDEGDVEKANEILSDVNLE